RLLESLHGQLNLGSNAIIDAIPEKVLGDPQTHPLEPMHHRYSNWAILQPCFNSLKTKNKVGDRTCKQTWCIQGGGQRHSMLFGPAALGSFQGSCPGQRSWNAYRTRGVRPQSQQSRTLTK